MNCLPCSSASERHTVGTVQWLNFILRVSCGLRQEGVVVVVVVVVRLGLGLVRVRSL